MNAAASTQNTCERLAPVIILGVPRSGTTLLRVILGSHSTIFATAETPWITGSYGDNSIRHLVEYLGANAFGENSTLPGATAETAFESGQLFADHLLRAALDKSGKQRVLLKTPDDVSRLDFLTKFFPASKFIHIYRDGRDVACSTVDQRDKMFSELLEGYGRLSVFTALQRWCDWESGIRVWMASPAGKSAMTVQYEQLVADPEPHIRCICQFLGIDFEPGMMSYGEKSHSLPSYEAGAQDVRRRPTIASTSVGRWKSDIPPWDMRKIDEQFGGALVRLGYKKCCDEVDLSKAPLKPTRRQLKFSTQGEQLRTARNLMRMLPRIPVKIAREIRGAFQKAKLR